MTVGPVSLLVPAPARRPDVHAFVAVGAMEAVVRGIMLSVYPLLMYRAWGEAAVVSKWYFLVGVVSLLTGLSVPLLARLVSRRWAYSMGVGLYLLSAGFGFAGGTWTTMALLCHVTGTAIVFVCFNAYVLDNVDKTGFGRLESRRLMFGAIGWTIGPVLGVWLLKFGPAAPFAIVGVGALTMLAAFWTLGLSAGRVSRQTRGASVNPLGFLRRFAGQPRLVAGWLFAVLRSCGWSVYTVYVGIFAVQSGLGEQIGGIVSSLANAGLFLAPLMLRWMHRRSVRHAVRAGFLMAGCTFVLGGLFSPFPMVTVVILVLASYALVLLDVVAGLPFLMAVKPSQRTEMSAVYSSFRDVSGIITPGLAWVVLQFSPLAGVFVMAGVALLVAWIIAGKLHPDLGVPGAQRARARRSVAVP